MTTLLTGGAVFDGRRHLGTADVLVRDGRIAEVGPGLPRDGHAVVDVAGGLVAPGFVDAHNHAVMGGLERIRCDLTDGHDSDDYLRIIAEYAAQHPDAPWITGGGWSMAAFPGGTPTAAALDAVVPDRPVFLPNRDHHGAWVNSLALELAGVDRDTPDPADGRIERDVDGRPSGTLHEGAMLAVGRLLPPTTGEEYDAALLEGQRHLHAAGVTGWQDAIIGDYAGLQDVGPVYREAARRGDLTADVVGALWWDRDRGTEQIPDLVRRREEYSHGRFRATSVKIMQDGVAENFTASLGLPYLDRCGRPTDNSGHSFVEAGLLREAVHGLDREGFQVHVHAIGDRGVREALDAFVGTDPAHRHHVAHLQLIDPVDLPRFAELGVAANLQMLWACLDDQMRDLTIPFLGAERAGWQYPFASLHRLGTALVAGSDWPVSSSDPLEAIHVAVNRAAPGTSGEPFLPREALDLQIAFAAYTSGSAWINRRADAGLVEPGAVADLVVLDRDPFAGAADDIGSARVVSTWVDGRAVFTA